MPHAALPVIDPVALTQSLIRCPSVTPADAGALDVLAQALTDLGFACHRMTFSEEGTPDIDNLYARLGTQGPNFCFAGHTDVVPVGDAGGWTVDPFAAEIRDGKLYGRGTADMKGAIAAFVAAVSRLMAAQGTPDGSISLLITGDEEGPSINGTRKVLDWMAERGETIDVCLVGEPTNPRSLGDMIKIGRRGSISGRITVHGTQGHVAYPHLADNPVPRLVRMVSALLAEPLDHGTEFFQPSNLEVVSVDVGNPTTNIIPGEARALFNIRFNTLHTGASLEAWIRARLDAAVLDPARDGDDADPAALYSLTMTESGEAFLTQPGPFSSLLAEAVQAVTGKTPDLSTSGGTSDARFIKNVCPVAEFGLVGQTMHKVNEHIAVEDLEKLTQIYQRMLTGYFAIGGRI